MSRGARFASGKIGRQGARGNAVFLTARQTGLWLVDADSRIRDSVYENPCEIIRFIMWSGLWLL